MMLGENMWIDEHGNTCIGINPKSKIKNKIEPIQEPKQEKVEVIKENNELKKEEENNYDSKKTVKRGRRKRP